LVDNPIKITLLKRSQTSKIDHGNYILSKERKGGKQQKRIPGQPMQEEQELGGRQS